MAAESAEQTESKSLSSALRRQEADHLEDLRSKAYESKYGLTPNRTARDIEKEEVFEAILRVNKDKLNELERAGVDASTTVSELNALLSDSASVSEAAMKFERLLDGLRKAKGLDSIDPEKLRKLNRTEVPSGGTKASIPDWFDTSTKVTD